MMNLRVPKMRGISWLAAEPVSFSRRTLLQGVSIYEYYIIFIIYYSSHSPSSLITESLSVTQTLLHTRRVSRITVKALVTSNIIQSVCLVGKGRLKERCGLEPWTNFFRLRNRQKLVRIRFGCGLDSRIYGMYYTSMEGLIMTHWCQNM